MMRQFIDLHPGRDGKVRYTIIALVDGDSAGKDAASILTKKHMRLLLNRDVFVLQPVMPRQTREPTTLGKGIARANEAWRQMACEIEDLLPPDTINVFCDEEGCTPRRMQAAGRTHYHFERHTKAKLVRFVERNAMLEDLEEQVELLKSLRFYVGLDPDGV